MLRQNVARAVSVSLLFTTTGCDPTRYITINKSASLEGSTEPFQTDADETWGNLPGRTCADFYMNPASTVSGFDRVGFVHSYQGGPAPLICRYRHNHVYRLAVRFDLASLQKLAPRVLVKSARLSFDKRRGLGNHECADKLLAITSLDPEPGSTVRPRGEERYDGPVSRLDSADCASGRCTMQVTGQVNDWVRGTVENMGFVLRGEDERLNANDNVSCTNDYANFRLDLDYMYDAAAPTRVPEIRIPPKTIPGGSSGTTPPPLVLKVALIREGAGGTVTYELRWSGTVAGVTDMNIFRGTTPIPTVNDGFERDQTVRGSVTYKICETGPSTRCSAPVTVST